MSPRIPQSLLASCLLTLAVGGRMLATPVALRPAGVLPFVLRFNVLAGALYLLAGHGILGRRAWAEGLAWALAGGTALVFLEFIDHVARGGAYLPRTFVALPLRSAFWFLQAWALGRPAR